MSDGTPWTPSARGPGYIGQSVRDYGENRHGARDEPWSRTCPMWFLSSPAIIGLWSDKDDYEAGRLGHVDGMESAYLDYLRILSSELSGWERWWTEEIQQQGKRR